MKGATAVLSATTLVLKLPTQLNSVLVRIHLIQFIHSGHNLCSFSTIHVADPPRITTHPRELKDVAPGKCAMFSVEATGTEPLSCKWEWNPAEDSSCTDEWQLCDLENFLVADSSTLTIPCVQTFNEGSYRCIISNCAGSQLSKAAQLSVGKILFIIHA